MIPEVPDGMTVQALYAPPEHEAYEQWIAQLSDVRFARIGLIVRLCGLGIVAAAVVVPSLVTAIDARTAATVRLVGVLVAVLGFFAIRKGGRSGYYDVRDDGTVGERIPREMVDLNGWTRIPLDGQAPA